ncbi:MAG: hypothetical protein ABR981_03555 [Candidatus Micrarchaeaceae archaeon]|jgi:uncharacterized membrane protein
MPRKKSLHDSKNADSCPCGCCKWHSSNTLRIVLGAMFILIVASFIASLVFARSSIYFSDYILSFMGIIFLIVFIGWVFSFFCSCRGLHWSRHGFEWIDNSRITARNRYAKGDISKKEYDRIMKDLD